MKDLVEAQQYMTENNIDLWLLYDFRGSNDVLWQLLGHKGFTTRRAFIAVPQNGPARALVHEIDKLGVEALLPQERTYYHSRHDMEEWLGSTIRPGMTVALEYSPDCAIPTLSIVDGGMLDLIRGCGASVVSSQDLFQRAVAVWDDDALKSHTHAVEQVVASLRTALDFVRRNITDGVEISEYNVQQLILQEFASRGLETDESPVVAVNENSGNPHYMPSEQNTALIERGDWLLIDLWARTPGNENIFADITWVAFVGTEASSKHKEIFDIVAGARDAVVTCLQDNWASGVEPTGWELDDIARDYIRDRGYGDRFIHRTGHSIGPGRTLHALGVNLDNFETHDTRKVFPGVGFSVEPGIYLPEFGVRSEIDVYVDPVQGPRVTTPLQTSVEHLFA
jgi:Xaa-Pro dipeptidase